MTAAVTLLSMRTQARQLASQENSTFVSDSELDTRINSAVRRLHDRLYAQGQEHQRKTLEMNTTSGQYLYNLPADFYRLLLLSCNRSAVMPTPSSSWSSATSDANDWRRMDPFMIQELPLLMNTMTGTADVVRYRMLGQVAAAVDTITQERKIEIRPTPRAVFTLRIDYIPTSATLTVSADEIDGLNGFEIIPILEAAIYLLEKEESDAKHLKEWLTREELRLDQVAPAQDHTAPETIVDLFGFSDDLLLDPFAYRVPHWRRP